MGLFYDICGALVSCIWKLGSFVMYIGLFLVHMGFFYYVHGALWFSIWGSCGVYGERALFLFS